MEKEYDEEVEEIDDDYSDEELTEEEKERIEIEKEQSTKVENGQTKYKNVDHSKRANKMGRISDSTEKRNITKYCNVALEYFGYRCALSGERFVSFNQKVEGKKSNLSAEHVIALALGGNDIVPNLAPTVWEYNRIKNGYYLLDYWNKQKDIEGKSLYSPYRLLKLVNYMMKSIEARDDMLKDRYRAYKKKLMTPNEIDEFLAEIEKQDEIEPDNSKKKIYSDTITATTEDIDNKKILTRVPSVEGAMLIQREQPDVEKQLKVDMMDIFLSDAVGLLKRERDLQKVRLKDKDGNEISLQDKLDEMLQISIKEIRFELEVRNAILEKLEALGVLNNKYSVANDLLNNTPMLEIANENRENVKTIVEDYIENQLSRIRETQILSEEQLKTVISNMPTVLYDEREMSKIKLWNTYRSNSFEKLISSDYTATDEFIDVLIILKNNGTDLSKIIVHESTIQDLLKEKGEEEQNKIINELQEISKEITKEWPIGGRLSNQKTRNMAQLKKEIEEAGIILTSEEKQKILEKESHLEKSERKTNEFVQVLVVLKNSGIDLSKIITGGENLSTIEDLLKEKEEEEQNKIINELQEISKEITKKWPIGVRLNAQKTRNMVRLKKEIDKAGIILTLEEQEMLLEKQEQMSRITTREFVQVLVVLKTNGIDLSKIVRSSKIENLIKEKEEEAQNKIIKELQEILEEITKEWPIGKKIDKQKRGDKIFQLKKEIDKAGIILTPEEKQKILGKEGNLEKSERITREFVQVLKVLKTNGINLAKVVQSSKIEDLIKENDEEVQNKIINELQEISKEITKKWPIGIKSHHQKINNIMQLKEEIEKTGLILTLEEQQKILEKEGKKELSERITREFVQVLIILRTNGIDLSKIVQKSKIEDLIKVKDEEEQNKIINELQEISEEITKDWAIGRRLDVQKQSKNIEQLKKEIKEAGLEEKLTDKERKKILESRAQKKVKQTVVEQKNKGELGQNQQIESEVFEETIRQAEQIQETETSSR